MSRRSTRHAWLWSRPSVEDSRKRGAYWVGLPLTALLTLLLLTACNRGAVGEGGVLVVREPADDSVVTTATVTVRGTAPPGATVVRDISLGLDQSVEAGSDGAWALEVELDEGENELTLRLGDDEASEQVISVTYNPLSVAEPADGSEVTTSTITVRGTASPGATVVRDISFAADDSAEADEEGNWAMPVELDEGENELTFRLGDDDWTATTIRIRFIGGVGAPSTPRASSGVSPSPATPEARIQALVADLFTGQTNWSTPQPTLRNIDIVAQVDGGWGVFVEFNASENVTAGSIKRGAELEMIAAYEALYAAGLDVTSATMEAWLPLVDQYGNEEPVLVYKTILEGDIAEQVNWDEAESLEWDNIWTVSVLDPALRE